VSDAARRMIFLFINYELHFFFNCLNGIGIFEKPTRLDSVAIQFFAKICSSAILQDVHGWHYNGG
jgi:hypothetical protein